jgi:hypothetical protein
MPGDGTAATFVRNLYWELLGRDADPIGFNYWSNRVASGQASRQDVVNGILHSQEYRMHYVQSLYLNFLGRAADSGGMQFFTNELAANNSLLQILVQIVGSQEYYLRNGGTPTGFVAGLYRDLMGRAPDAGGDAYWIDRANNVAQNGNGGNGNGDSRDRIVRDFLLTEEGIHRLADGDYGANTPNAPNPPAGAPEGGSYALADVTGDGYVKLFFPAATVPQDKLNEFYDYLRNVRSNGGGDNGSDNDLNALATLLASDRYFYGPGGNNGNAGGNA